MYNVPFSNLTEKSHVAMLFERSVKLYRTEVTPRGNAAPGWCDRVLVGIPHTSVAVGSVHVMVLLVVPSSVVA